MRTASRFCTPASHLGLKVLMGRGKRAVLASAGIAALVHLCLAGIAPADRQRQAAKPLTTQFVKRQPRLTKPLEMKKRPRPKRRHIERTMVSVKARVERRTGLVSVQAPRLVNSLARPAVSVARRTSVLSCETEPRAVAEAVVGTKQSRDVVDMSLEMVDVRALDTGRYQAMVVQDPSDKRGISGYFHFWMPWGQHYSEDGTLGYDWPNMIKHAVRRLVLKLNEWTDIEADIKGIIGFDARELLDTPWVVLYYWYKMYPTDAELGNIGRYMHNGGFIHSQGEDTPVIRDALEYGGSMEFKDWNWERLSHSHPIFHCYFDFPGGPPPGMVSIGYSVAGYGRAPDPPKVEAIEIDGQVAAIRDNAAYIDCWGYVGKGGLASAWNNYDARRQLEFGVNSVIFALTQEGSITHRVMNAVQ